MSRRNSPRYEVVPGDGVIQDVTALAVYGNEVVEAGAATVDDLAHGRVVGKQLGERRVTGDLSGIARVKFDLPGDRPQRFRLLYRKLDATTLEIVAIGLRDEHAIYRAAIARLGGRRDG